MPLSSILTIVLRLFSLLWLVQGLSMFASVAVTLAPFPSQGVPYFSYTAHALMVIIAVGMFVVSSPLARFVTPAPNPEVSLGTLSQHDLYCFAFTFLGLYFALSSFANSINWLHYFFLLVRSTNEHDPQRQKGFYELTQHLITLAAGIALLLFAPRCARKLTSMQR